MTKKEKQQGITVKKFDDFGEWYTQVIQKAELIEYTDVSGCIVFRPYSYAIWEKLQANIDKLIKNRGVQNAYFPLFIPEKLLVKESEHVEGFSPEVAWVTHAGNTKLTERLAIRPTSETIMYDSYKKWIRSHRDLPLKINQWCSVVRWEFKHPIPFLRTREFLWQEGHTAFATKKEADEEAMDILVNVYNSTLKDMLALPTIIGTKSEKEKFAGAEYSLSAELFLPNNKAIQGCTSHHLSQNFSKPFNLQFIDENEKKQFVYQNSWGFSTRTIGIAIMVHSDDKGLVLPPKIAPIQAVIIPILFDKTKNAVLKEAKKVVQSLKGISVHLDDREEYRPGWKYNEWELKGVPLRVEFGPKDMEKKQAMIVRRDTGEKIVVKLKDINKKVNELLEKIQDNLYTKAKKFLNSSIDKADNKKDFLTKLKAGKLVLAPFCNTVDCEDILKDATGGAKSINTPFDKKELKNTKCVFCNKPAKELYYFAKSY